MHSQIDLLELEEIKLAYEQYMKTKELSFHGINYFNIQTILSTYEGHTVFSIFQHYYGIYQRILNQLKQHKFMTEVNDAKEETESSQLRLLYRILSMPTVDIKPKLDLPVSAVKAGCSSCKQQIDKVKNTEECQGCKGFMSIMHKSVYYEDERFRDILIQIANMCKETDITNLFFTLNDMGEMFCKATPIMAEFFENCYSQNSYCEKIKSVKWN